MKIISAVFHPLLIATHLTTLLLLKAPELLPRIQQEAALHFLLIVFIITAVMPAISMVLLRTFHYISDFELNNRSERALPFSFILFYYAIACYLFMVKLEMEFIFNVVMVSVTVLIFILLLVSTKFKISIHAAAVWGAVGYLTAIMITQNMLVNNTYYLTVLAAGLTTSSRLYLGYHTSKEAWSGALLGFSYSFAVLMILL